MPSGIPVVKREKWVSSRTSGVSGSATVGTFKTVDGVGLEELDQLLLMLDLEQVIAGTSPTMDIYLQIAVVPNPDPTVDAHWDDYAKFNQTIPASSTADTILALVIQAQGQTVANNTFGAQHTRGVEQGAFTGGNMFPYHWGDRLRIREVMGGTVTTPSIYSLYATGMRRK